MNDPDWLRFIGDRGVRTVDDARGYIEKGPMQMYARLGFGLYLVELKDATPIGLCGLIKRATLEDVDIGFAFLPEFRGLGYAQESAVGCVTTDGRARPGAHRGDHGSGQRCVGEASRGLGFAYDAPSPGTPRRFLATLRFNARRSRMKIVVFGAKGPRRQVVSQALDAGTR